MELSDADAEVSLELPYPTVARVAKTKLAIFMGPERDATIGSALLVRCY